MAAARLQTISFGDENEQRADQYIRFGANSEARSAREPFSQGAWPRR